MSTEHAEKTHPLAAYIFAAVLAGLSFMLVAALNDYTTAAFAAPLLVGWAWVSLALFGRLDQADAAADAH